MKYFILALLLIGCSKSSDSNKESCKNNLDKCVLIRDSNLSLLNNDCEKLATCMGSEWEIIHFSNQPNNPYACSIWKKTKNYGHKGTYFYPKGSISFGRVEFEGLDNEIAVCELMTETGQKSDKRYKELEELFKKIDEDRAKRGIVEPRPKPLKIRESQ